MASDDVCEHQNAHYLRMMSERDDLRAEMADLRDALVSTLSAAADRIEAEKRKRDEARRELADLRAGVAALADTKPGATGRALRALLAAGWTPPTVKPSVEEAWESLRAELGHWLAQHDAELRAEVERLREVSAAQPYETERELAVALDEARRALADLRAGIEALLPGETVNVHAGGGNLVSQRRVVNPDRLRDLLAGSGEQPGEVTHACPGDEGLTPCCGRTPFELPSTDRMTLDAELVTCHRPAPAVPDGADVRERVRRAVKRAATWTEDGSEYEEAPDAGMVEEITDAVLAVAGQGVTVDDVPEQIARYVEATATDLSPSGYRAGIATAVRLIRRWRPEYAAVRPSEKGQVDD